MDNDNRKTTARSRIEGITTHWSVVKDTSHFTLRYAPAIRSFIASMATNPSDVEDILQDFLIRVVQRGFERERIDEGKFRYYLKAAIRNAVRSHYRRQRPDAESDTSISDLASPTADSSDEQWTTEWRRCLLDRTWQALERFQNETQNRFAYTVLQTATRFPSATSAQLALRFSELTGKNVSADAFRQQLHRARKKFSELLIDEVAATLDHPTSDAVELELVDLGLIEYVRNVWQDR